MSNSTPKTKYYQISSGRGPAECEFAAFLVFDWLVREDLVESDDPDSDNVIDIVRGQKDYDDYRSIFFKTNADLSQYLGSIQVCFRSPYREDCGRKNWFVSMVCFGSADELEGFDPNKIQFSTARSGGPGGQHLNKTESAVRAKYLPTGFTTVAREERSQHLNKKNAIERIQIHLLDLQNRKTSDEIRERWEQHNNLRRGDPSVVFRYDGTKLIVVPPRKK